MNNFNDETFVFSEEELAVICGTVLGDGHINKRGTNSYRLKVEHGTDQKEYCEWKRSKLIRFCAKNKEVHAVFNSKINYTSWRFYADSGLRWKKVYSMFYRPF